jgi:hypothetical protein
MTLRFTTRVLRLATVMTVAASVTSSATLLSVDVAGAKIAPGIYLARELLTHVIVPPRATLAHPATDVVCQCAYSASDVSAVHHYYIVPESAKDVEKYLTTHIPQGATYDGSVGTSSSNNAAPVLSIIFTYRVNGPHVYLKQLAYSMTQRTSSTSWLRVDSQIVWVPSRTASQKISQPVSAVLTGYKVSGLSGTSGDVRIDLTGKTLANLINQFNELPLGPNNMCMEDLGGFSMTLTLKSGAHLQIFNGFCAGSFDSVSVPNGNSQSRYQVSDHSCGFMGSVVSLLPAASVPGSRAALRQCEIWSKTIDSK